MIYAIVLISIYICVVLCGKMIKPNHIYVCQYNIWFTAFGLQCLVFGWNQYDEFDKTNSKNDSCFNLIYSIEIIIFMWIYHCELVEKTSKCPNRMSETQRKAADWWAQIQYVFWAYSYHTIKVEILITKNCDNCRNLIQRLWHFYSFLRIIWWNPLRSFNATLNGN